MKKRYANLEKLITSHLNAAKALGVSQRELFETIGISKSYLSEILSSMEERKLISRKLEPGKMKRIWSSEFFPGFSQGILRIGMLKSSEYLPLLHSIRKKAESAGILLRVRVYRSALSLIDDLKSGILEIAFAPLYTSVVSTFTASNLRIVHLIASGGAGIFRKTGYDGTSCRSTEVSSMILMLRAYLDSTGLKPVIEPFTDPCLGMNGFLSGKYGQICIWEPFASHLRHVDHVNEMAEYSGLLGDLPCCCVVVRNNTIELSSSMIRDCKTVEFDAEDVEKIGFCGFEGSVNESISRYNFNVDRSFAAFTGFLSRLGLTVTERSARKFYVPAIE